MYPTPPDPASSPGTPSCASASSGDDVVAVVRAQAGHRCRPACYGLPAASSPSMPGTSYQASEALRSAVKRLRDIPREVLFERRPDLPLLGRAEDFHRQVRRQRAELLGRRPSSGRARVSASTWGASRRRYPCAP